MRKEKALITLLRGLVELVAEESDRNPEFGAKVEGLLLDVSDQRSSKKKAVARQPESPVPDIHAEWNSRGEMEFRLWLRDQPIPTLRTIVRSQDFDPTRRTVKWKEAEKLAEFIADSLRARLARGSAFIGTGGVDS